MSNGDDKPSEQNVGNWAAVIGRWRFDDGGRTIYEGPQKPEWPFGICLSNVRFSEGEVRVTVQQNNGPEVDGRVLLGYRSPTADYFAIGLGGYGDAYTMTHFNVVDGWRNIASAGRKENLTVGRLYELCVRVRGQRIAFEVDGVRVLEHLLEMPLPYGQLGLFVWGDGTSDFTKVSVRKDPGEVFVVMQFSGFQELYADVIRPITKEFGLEPYRADEVFGPGNIIEDIIHGIETAQIIIAEITPSNENVFYEVGYAHALKKPTILLADRGKKLPFDISGRRC